MPNVLMLCYYYPPLGGIGSQRSQKFASYLPDHGWHPIVLTPERGSYMVDNSLDDGKSKGVEVIRTPYVDLSSGFKRAVKAGTHAGESLQNGNGNLRPVRGDRLVNLLRRTVRTCVYIPDGQVGWYPYAVRAGRREIERQNVDAIYSSSFPVTAHMAACRLKAATNKPWIADFRDLWTENHYADYSSSMRKRLDQIIESELLEKADVIITVSTAWADTLRRMTGGRKRVEVIRNGFDAGEFAKIKRNRPEKWAITYVGNFYGAKQDPSVFLQSLRRLIDDGQIIKEDAAVNIIGAPDPFVQDLVTQFDVADITNFTGFISHGESLRHQVNSSLLLLIVHGDKANSGLIPGKLYEYLGSRRPILAIIPASFEAARIIRETRAGVAVEASDANGIKQALLDSYSAHKAGVTRSNDESELSAYERKHGAAQLAQILTELRGGSKTVFSESLISNIK